MTAPKTSDKGGVLARWSSECKCGAYIERGKTYVTYERGVQVCMDHRKAAS